MSQVGIAQTRQALGSVGAFLGLPAASPPPIPEQRAGVQRVGRAGYRAVWTNENIGADALVRASLWLAASEQLVIGTCIANMWARPAQTAHAAATQLAQAYPGRFILGLGIGYPEQAASVGRGFGSPVATAREYLRVASDPSYPRLLAANGPRMLALAGELADGALPAGAAPSFTAVAREAVGAHRLVIVYLPVQESDAPEAVADSLQAHLSAGADHVVVGMSYNTGFATAIERLELLAPTIAAFPA